MKRSIIHKDYLLGFQRCNEELFHPSIEDFAIGDAIVNTFGNGLAIGIPGDNVRHLKFLPSHKAKHLLPFADPAFRLCRRRSIPFSST
jgi:hypothetical protein